jgi:hypothetical protein
MQEVRYVEVRYVLEVAHADDVPAVGYLKCEIL